MSIDKADKFISLWIAFNGWMKGKFGENITDRNLIKKVKELKEIKNVFNALKLDFQFNQSLNRLRNFDVIDMRDIDNEDKIKRYDGTFESLIETVYQIRCNLFHGRKDTEEDEKDFELICISYDILLPLFKKYLESNS
ncbi:unnamed protein product [marine sediment metagenome]|uniref:Apea-like HEPN domain-containing protein n=1 Tax=marine sediment metagenome TaxID=412755 RepID=X1GDS0_9ZZZZ